MRVRFTQIRNKLYAYTFITLLIGLLMACTESSTNSSTPASNSDSVVEVAYPSAESAPPTLPSAYPPPVIVEEFKEPRFRFDLPLVANSTTVIGQALPNMSVAVVDITFNGIILGSGVSDDDGRFDILVKPLPQGHRIGLTFAELKAGKTFEETSIEYFPHRGDGFMNIPNVGIFFDTHLVE